MVDAAARTRHYRQRRREEKRMFVVEADEFALCEFLTEGGFLRACDSEDPAKVGEAFQRFVEVVTCYGSANSNGL